MDCSADILWNYVAHILGGICAGLFVCLGYELLLRASRARWEAMAELEAEDEVRYIHRLRL